MVLYFDSLNIYVNKAVSVTTVTPYICGFNGSPEWNTSSRSAQTDGNSASAWSSVTLGPGSRRSSLGLLFRGEKLNQLVCLQNINGTEGKK